MAIDGEYAPSTWDWVAQQVELYERTGGKEGATLRDTGIPIIVLTVRGAVSGKVRKFALMRVERDGQYALVASMGGAPVNPKWYANALADPENVWIQDGPEPKRYVVHEAFGEEKASWWPLAVSIYPPYEEYQSKTERIIPLLVATPA